jgi:nuclear pore complex protein Nup107
MRLALMHSALGSGKLGLARGLLGVLPRELSSVPEPEASATELHDYRRLVAVWDALDRVDETAAQDVHEMGREARQAWTAEYKVTCVNRIVRSATDDPAGPG